VQVPGCAALARWGLLDQVLAAGTPPTRTVRFDQPGAAFSARLREFEGVDLMCSPRRLLLDTILVEAARQTGPELRGRLLPRPRLPGGGPARARGRPRPGPRGRTKGGPAGHRARPPGDRRGRPPLAGGQADRRGQLPDPAVPVDGLLHLLVRRAGPARRAAL